MQLPTDVLLQIFLEHLHRFKDEFDSAWFTVTHVSHRWRSIALQYPLLWNFIVCPTMPPVWVQEFIRRSGSAPLLVSLHISNRDPGPQYWRDVTPLLADAVHRVASFTSYDHTAIRDRVQQSTGLGLNFSTSPLKSVELSGLLEMQWGNASHLQFIRTQDARVSLSQGLTSLTLKRPARSMPTKPEFYTMLSSLPKLRCLVLVGILTALKTCKAQELPPIVLPSLVTLELERDPKECYSCFLTRALIPRVKTLSVIVHDKQPISMPMLIEPLSQLCKHTAIVNRCLSARGFHLAVTIAPSESNIFTIRDLHDGCRIFYFEWYRCLPNMKQFSGFISCFPLDNLRSFEIDWTGPSSSTFLAFLNFSRFPALESLTLWGESLFPALLDTTPSCECAQNDERHVPPPGTLLACISCQEFAASLFPSLRALCIKDAGEFDPDKVLRFLAHRSDCGRPLDSISIQFPEWVSDELKEPFIRPLRGKGDVIQFP
ncbi:hypothetical protein AX16_002117 [Volvariella volvacea WC 439]|nr:hypothetical protein AX16_002117 [Volvariella volvacea WC 439]